MNIQEACKNLDISISIYENEDIPETVLIKQYRKMSLLYHPDKNKSVNSIQNFQKIHDSYEFLGKYLGYIDEDYYIDEYEKKQSEPMGNFLDYKDIFMNLLDFTLGDDIINQIQNRLLNKFLNIERINNYIDHIKLMKIYNFLLVNKSKYNITDEFLISIENIIHQLDHIRNDN